MPQYVSQACRLWSCDVAGRPYDLRGRLRRERHRQGPVGELRDIRPQNADVDLRRGTLGPCALGTRVCITRWPRLCRGWLFPQTGLSATGVFHGDIAELRSVRPSSKLLADVRRPAHGPSGIEGRDTGRALLGGSGWMRRRLRPRGDAAHRRAIRHHHGPLVPLGPAPLHAQDYCGRGGVGGPAHPGDRGRAVVVDLGGLQPSRSQQPNAS
mmetsp:Transcript_83312/g.231182  ORF Transcript_83312/g.231182 Transcript_83312/m.231182 type:complete len:211 (+) Transcript_83312:297-929(+)